MPDRGADKKRRLSAWLGPVSQRILCALEGGNYNFVLVCYFLHSHSKKRSYIITDHRRHVSSLRKFVVNLMFSPESWRNRRWGNMSWLFFGSLVPKDSTRWPRARCGRHMPAATQPGPSTPPTAICASPAGTKAAASSSYPSRRYTSGRMTSAWLKCWKKCWVSWESCKFQEHIGTLCLITRPCERLVYGNCTLWVSVGGLLYFQVEQPVFVPPAAGQRVTHRLVSRAWSCLHTNTLHCRSVLPENPVNLLGRARFSNDLNTIIGLVVTLIFSPQPCRVSLRWSTVPPGVITFTAPKRKELSDNKTSGTFSHIPVCFYRELTTFIAVICLCLFGLVHGEKRRQAASCSLSFLRGSGFILYFLFCVQALSIEIDNNFLPPNLFSFSLSLKSISFYSILFPVTLFLLCAFLP